MAIRIRRPESARIAISEGDWLEVKKHLTAGERRQMLSGARDAAGLIDPFLAGRELILTYLLAWSLQGLDGEVIPIHTSDGDVDRGKLRDALDAIDADTYIEIREAIDKHDDAMKQERAQEKKAPAGGST